MIELDPGAPSRRLVQALFAGPIDVVGDVHGEIDPLRELLERLGYDDQGRHPEGRRMVFVGDLGDRGPDSPAVIELVRTFVEAGRAQCLLGNHELNLLRNAGKPGNRWFIDPAHSEQQPGGEFSHCRVAPAALKPLWLRFLASLPLALERPDLRVVHAAWVPGEIDAIRRVSLPIVAAYKRFEDRTESELVRKGLQAAAAKEEALWGRMLDDPSAKVPLLAARGEIDERHQMGNPVRVVTSGVERLAQRPFWASGQWRMCDRVAWWDDYHCTVPVVVGHYWRRSNPAPPPARDDNRPEMFDVVGPTDWVGPHANVFCVDFSIGARYEERRAGITTYDTHLAAMRWPERELFFETGSIA